MPQVLSEAQLEALTRDDPLLRAFAARDPNAPTTALRRAVEDEDIPADAPAFNINLGVLGLELTSAVTDFQEGTPLHAAAGCDPHPHPPPSPSPLTTHRSPLTAHRSPLTLTLTSHLSPQPGVGDFNWTQQLQAADAAARVQLTSAFSDAGDAVNATTTPWWAAVGQGLQAVGGGLQVAGSFVANVTSGTGSAISGATGAIANATAAAASGTGTAISGAGSAISGGAANATAAVTSATARITKPAGSAFAGATGAVSNATAAAGSWSGSAIVNVTEGVTSSLSAFEPRLPRPRRRRGNATTSVDSKAKGQPLSEKIAAEFSEGSKDSKDRLAEVGHAGPASRLAEAVVVTRSRRRKSNSTLLERVLLSGGSVPPFANGRVVERAVSEEATAPAQNATTVPAGFGEPAAQDPDEWW